MKGALSVTLALALSALAHGRDKSSSYQLGIYITSDAVSDNTSTNTTRCNSDISASVCSGGLRLNQVTIYQIQVPDGVWHLETYRQAEDSMARSRLGFEPTHFKAEKDNPLDLLKSGDKVLFRVEIHKKLLGTETDVFVPFASNPNKEAKFIGSFAPAVAPEKPITASDNVRAMCDAHKLSPALERQMCTQQDGSASNPRLTNLALSQDSTARKRFAETVREKTVEQLGSQVADGFNITAEGLDATLYVYHVGALKVADCNSLFDNKAMVSNLQRYGFTQLICTDDKNTRFGFDLTGVKDQSPVLAPSSQEQPISNPGPATSSQCLAIPVVGEHTTTASGLEYWDIEVGSGVTAHSGQHVSVSYTGWFTNGKQFDSSVGTGRTFDFVLGAGVVMKGWDEGIAGMRVGGKRKLCLLPQLAYGAVGYPPLIPANSTLIFVLQLLEAK